VNAEMFWSCVLAILFLVGIRTTIVLTLVALENWLKSKAEDK